MSSETFDGNIEKLIDLTNSDTETRGCLQAFTRLFVFNISLFCRFLL